jgi:hypothetical protein
MEMESNIVLNGIDYNFFVKTIRIKDFKNSKNRSQDQTKGSIKNIKKKGVKTGIKSLKLVLSNS